MKPIYCAGCNTLVAKIEKGSKLKKGFVALCRNCETKRIAADLAMSGAGNQDDVFSNFMNSFMK